MNLKCKCKNCNKILKSDDSVFIRVIRYDTYGRRVKNLVFCTNCWDNTRIQVPYIKEDNARTCGNCKHLIFKDYRENTGACRLTRLYRRFTDICVHEEEMS